jgi:CelD/BcsL family acetyltransferase involved in cellulose biosynthesis
MTDSTDKLAELRSERTSLAATMTKEDVADKVGSWLEVARAQSQDSAVLVVNGQATGEHLHAVLAEQALADRSLHGRLVDSLVSAGFGTISAREKAAKLKALDSAIEKAAGEVGKAERKRRQAERDRELEAEFGPLEAA